MSSDKEKRVTITFTDPRYHGLLNRWAKNHKLTQGEVIEVMLDNVQDEDRMEYHMEQRRAAKVAGRTSIRSMIERQKQQKREGK